ncbi:MAG TPA: Gfo/Idh/MocA family oxidoreductase [Symbiobacteriaceae bacterium]|nr:Gfo/Idh/MocA family oxidoreductase [Symbiobacteriaceae bacterium]
MMKPQLRIGMVGYKFMGKAHSNAYRSVARFMDVPFTPVLQAICGRDRGAVAEAAARYGWQEYETDWRRLVARPDIDVIDIGTPNNSHCEIALAAARAGKHILCEKPLAMTVAEAREMLAAVQSAGVTHMLCHNYRFAPAVRLAKRLIDEGHLGQIYHFRGVYLQDWIMNPDFPLVWRLQGDIAGSGSLGDLGAHTIDLARFLVGEFSEVVGLQETFIKERPVGGEMDGGLGAGGGGGGARTRVTVDDATAFLARFENGAVGTFEATRFAGGNRNGNRWEINGSKGSIRWNMEEMNWLEVYFHDDPPGLQGWRRINCTEAVHPYAGAWWPPGHIIGYEHTFVHAVYELLHGIAGQYSPAPNFEDGLRNQQVLDAVERSAASRAWVQVERG